MTTVKYRGFDINIRQDENSTSPREWDNLGTMVCFHRRYNLGDKHSFSSPADFYKDFLTTFKGVVLPLYLYDHSGITMNTTGFSCGWDSGQVGWIYITDEKILSEYGGKRVTAKLIERVKGYLVNEVKTYDDFLRGNVYGFQVVDNEEMELDSCWGFYGDHEKSGLLDEAKGSIDAHIEAQIRERVARVKQHIKNRVPLNKRHLPKLA